MLEAAAGANLLALATLLPHGVDKMSHAMPRLVETSCNLAAVKHVGDTYEVRFDNHLEAIVSLSVVLGAHTRLCVLCMPMCQKQCDGHVSGSGCSVAVQR